MVPIKIEQDKFERIKKEYLEKVKELFLDKRYKKDKNKEESKRDKLFEAINKELTELGIKESLEEIFIADFEILKKVKDTYDKNKKVFESYKNNKDAERKNKYIKGSIYEELYRKFNLLDKSWLIRNLGVTVCPYCNRSFINNRNKSTVAQLDHFYPRSKYPIFSLSLCNLIPSCYACNHIKRDKEISASPYDKNIKFDKEVKFSYIPLSADYLEDSNELKIIVERSDKVSQNITNMKIEDAYQLNTDYILELIKKAKIYNKEFKKELFEQYGDIISSEEDLNRLLYGNYLNREDVGKRPLAKLTYDILEELEAIK